MWLLVVLLLLLLPFVVLLLLLLVVLLLLLLLLLVVLFWFWLLLLLSFLSKPVFPQGWRYVTRKASYINLALLALSVAYVVVVIVILFIVIVSRRHQAVYIHHIQLQVIVRVHYDSSFLGGGELREMMQPLDHSLSVSSFSSDVMYGTSKRPFDMKYPQVRQAAQCVEPLVQRACDDANASEIELELRFGKVHASTYFQPGVTKAFFTGVVDRLAGTQHVWNSNAAWEESEVFYFIHNQQEYRTIVTYSSSGLCARHERKVLLENATFKYVGDDDGDGENGANNHNAGGTGERGGETYDVRVSLKREIHVEANAVPTAVETKRVVIRQRKRFYYGLDGVHGNPVWAYDCTRTWTAVTRSDAVREKQNRDPEYHIEIECLQPRWYSVDRPGGSHYMTALSLFLKAQDFMNNNIFFHWAETKDNKKQKQ